MGISGLRKHVERFEHAAFLGCENAMGRCFLKLQIVIDGPSLAYFIQENLPKGLAQPSYSLIRQRVLDFLTRLERYGGTITAIYFDGYLPHEKRPERVARLRKGYKQVSAFQRANPNGIKAKGNYGRTPALPFLVPAAIEALTSSPFRDRTFVVPGEADIYCAPHVRQYGGVVLSTDSDLLVHDLGGGAVSFFAGIRSSRCTRCQGACLRALKSYKPYQFAQQLEVPHILRFAFELVKDPKATFDDAVRRAQQPIQPQSVQKYEQFYYTYSSLANLTCATTWNPLGGLLDPRISELILQIETVSDGVIYYYLPPLLDDPAGSTAWECGADLRVFSYSVMLPHDSTSYQQIQVLEHQRRGEDVNPVEVEVMNPNKCNAFARLMTRRIRAISRLHGGPMTAACWRVFGAVQVLLTYIHQQPSFPKGQILEQLSDGLYKGDLRSWTGIYVHARLQAVLYSLRQVKQILDRLRLRGVTSPVSELAHQLQSLPGLESLIPGYDEIFDSFDVEKIMQPVDWALNSSVLTDSTLVATQSRWELPRKREEPPRNKEELLRKIDELLGKRVELPVKIGELPIEKKELPTAKEELPRTREELSMEREELPKTKEQLPGTKEQRLRTKEELPRPRGRLSRTREGLPVKREEAPTERGELRTPRGTKKRASEDEETHAKRVKQRFAFNLRSAMVNK